MSETDTGQQNTQPNEPADDSTAENSEERQSAERSNAEWAELRKTKREADALRRKLKEFEDRDKTEAQKLAERAEAAEKRAAEIEARALRLEVATEKGLTARQVKWLTGSTREELEANADEIREEFTAAKEADRPPVFNGGPRKTAEQAPNMNDLIRSRTGRG